MAKKTTKLDKAMGKGEILAELAASTELPKKEVGRVLDALAALIERHIAKRSVGTFTLPGLLRVKVDHPHALRHRSAYRQISEHLEVDSTLTCCRLLGQHLSACAILPRAQS